jgi:DNA-binding HxlR family transcriptional regulator
MPRPLTKDRLAILAVIREVGESICTGTCEHRKPGELHCLHISQRINISSAGVKRRLREMVLLGLLDRQRVNRWDGKVMARYTLTEKGMDVLEAS